VTERFDDDSFLRTYGRYLSNAKAGLAATEQRPGTCRVCATPIVTNFSYCPRCQEVRKTVNTQGIPFPLDNIAFLTYAVEGIDIVNKNAPSLVEGSHEREGRQAYAVLKGYKVNGTPRPWRITAAAWTAWFLQKWGAWSRGETKQEWWWAVIPSVRSERHSEHPLHRIVSAVLIRKPEVKLKVSSNEVGRQFNPELFSCDPIPDGVFVLLIDDSWTSGCNAFSGAAALKRAGATTVNAMVLGRLLNPGAWLPARTFIDQGGLRADFGDGLRAGFDPRRSPWAKVS
jgi:hypothetical protein